MPPLDALSMRDLLRSSFHLQPGPLLDQLNAHAKEGERAATALWRRDASIWSSHPDVQRKIANRLGWLDSPAVMVASLERLSTFAAAVRRDGVTDVVLLGMGGSSLAPEVLRAVVGIAPGWPRFQMLDSTDPDAVRRVRTPPEHTLYIVASKSGTTIEPNSLAAHFRRRLETAGVEPWASHFVAITDEGTELAARARTENFRDLFINPSDIGGRYSALSFFGLVPAALMGQDCAALVAWGVAMLEASRDEHAATSNPSVALGLALGLAARESHRDKLTLVLPPALEPFGLWIEQLIAESTGKQGTGIIPVAGERLGLPGVYGQDRFFVRVGMPGAADPAAVDLSRVRATGAPAAEIDLPEPTALGAEFVRWEIATAIAGAVLAVNPFDEPNVQQAKDATRSLLDRYKSDGELPAPASDRTLDSGPTLTLSRAAREALVSARPEAILTVIRPGDYFALLAYLGPDPALARELDALRQSVRDRTRAATMFGYGPRYLHSTGQLHKGGPDTGVFVLITAMPRQDEEIPGEAFSFGTLERAQALGDFASLDAAGRRALHVHLPAPEPHLIREMTQTLLGSP